MLPVNLPSGKGAWVTGQGNTSVLGFSRETGPVGVEVVVCIYGKRVINFKELAHTIMGTGKS